MPVINIDRTERWPYYFVTDAQHATSRVTGVDVTQKTYDELLLLADASTRLQTQLSILWGAADEEHNYQGDAALRLDL